MSLFVLGVNAKTASLALREQLLFLPEQQPAVYAELLQQSQLRGALLLSTCNRSEMYLDSPSTAEKELMKQSRRLLHWWGERQGVGLSQLQLVYCYQQQQAVHHLLRVAVGLDSRIVGESSILGQLRQAYGQAQQQQAVTPQLNWLFQQVFHHAKQIRRFSRLGVHAISLATRVCQLVRQQFHQEQPLLLLIGAGEAITAVAQQLHKRSLGRLLIAVRCPGRARLLAESVNAQVVDLQILTEWLPRVDGVISATGSSQPILNQSMVAAALQQRAPAPLLLVDLAVPRDMAADVAELSAVKLYTLEQLQGQQQQQQQQQQAAYALAEARIEPVAAELIQRLHRRQQAAKLICPFRAQGQQQRQRLEQQAIGALQRGVAAEQVVRQLASQLTNQLLHQPTQWISVLSQAFDGPLPQLQHQIRRLLSLLKPNIFDRKSPS